MSNIIEIASLVTNVRSVPAPVAPVPRIGIQVRLASVSDVPFIDGLQKMHTHMR